MGYFDDNGVYNDVSYGLDTHQAVAGEPSIFESIWNLQTKGVPLIGLSIINSFVNTAVDIGNFLGGDFSRLTIEDMVGDGSILDYYKKHSQGIETIGLVLGSFIPGTLAVKGLSIGVKANYLARAGYSTEVLSQATGLLAPMKARVLANAVTEIRSGSAALYGSLRADKLKLFALGAADNVLQSLVYEAATVATMKASPLLDEDSFQDVMVNILAGMAIGGVVGGTIDGIIVNKALNKLKITADSESRPFEMVTRLGIGNYAPGDQVASILGSVADLPKPTTVLASKKQAAAVDTAIVDARKILRKAAVNDDAQLANAVIDSVLETAAGNTFNKDEIFEKFSRLSKLSRLGAEPSVPTGEIFYVNQFAKGSKIDVTKLITSTPQDIAKVSLSYKLRPGATNVEIKHGLDTIEVSPGVTFPKYASAKEAFAEGADIFVATNGKVSINPHSPNLIRAPRPGEGRKLSVKEELAYRSTGKLPDTSAPLYTSPLVLDLQTKNLFEADKVLPQIGDLGNIQIYPNAIVAGKTNFPMQTEQLLDVTKTTPLEANARFVWARERGIRRGDTIQEYDIPMLEALYERAPAVPADFEKYLERLQTGMKVTLPEGADDWLSKDDLLKFIRARKDEEIVTMLSNHPDMSITAMARYANVEEAYIVNRLQSDKIDDYVVPTDSYKKIRHVQLEYDISTLNIKDGNVARGEVDVAYRIQLAKSAAESAVAAEFGEDYTRFLAKDFKTGQADIAGVGPGFVTSSNAGYKSIGQRMERIGFAVTDIAKTRDQKVANLLAPHIENINRDPELAAEVGNFINVRRRTGETYEFLPEAVAKKYWRDNNTVVLSKSLIRDKDGNIVDWDPNFKLPGFMPGAAKADPNVITNSKELHVFYDLSPRAAAFERINMQINNERIAGRNNWWAAQGINKTLPSNVLYAPPIDTGKYPYFFFVRPRPGTAFVDGSPAVVTAASAAELEKKAAALVDDYEVIYKADVKRYREALGDYQYDRNFANSVVNADLRRRGILNDIFPDIRAESIARDYADFHARQNLRIIRDFVELGNAQLFAELRTLGQRFTAAETSRTGPVSAFLGKSVPNPFNSYINTALALPERGNYSLWADANEKLEAFASTAFTAAKNAFRAAKRGDITYEKAVEISKRFGLGNPYEAATNALKAYEDYSVKLPPQRYLSQWVSTSHSILAASAIRLDMFQSLINAVSTPILALPEAISAIKANRDFITTALPSGQKIPSVMKLMVAGINSYFNPTDPVFKELLPALKKEGIVRSALELQHSMLADLAAPLGSFSENTFTKSISSATEKGARLMGNELSEEFSRYLPAYMAYKIFGPGGANMQGAALFDNIATFVNRVQGNYISSQRPILFQGPLGQSMTLFMTYQFNLMQQVFRFIENGDRKSLAILAGMQTTLFGLQGLPGFQLLNNTIIGNASNNPEHKDFYSTIPNMFDRSLGNLILYGSVSNILQTGLYTRGDINPRQLSIVPLNPMDFPAISAGIRFTENLINTAKTITKGGDITNSLLMGLEHNSLSRPLTGIAQLLQGHATTRSGNLVATTTGPLYEDLFSIANFSRLLGARPLDEAIIMDALYRKTAYQAKDVTRIKELGTAVKTHLYANGTLDPQQIAEFAAKYAKAGGDITNFSRKIMEWTGDANSSVANEIFTTMKRGHMQQLQMIMGGQRLPDYRSPSYLGNPNLPAGTRLAPDGQYYSPDPNNPGGWMRAIFGGNQ